MTNETIASVGGGADIYATGDLGINAEEDTDLLITTVAGAGGITAVSGGVSVGVIDNTTKAYVEDGAAELDAGGITKVKADSTEKIVSVTGAAAGGGVGVAGAVSAKVVSSATVAYIGNGAKVNQNLTGAAQDVIVEAKDNVVIDGGAGTAAIGIAGFGGTADINIVKNTTTAYLGNSVTVDAGRDVTVLADSTKDVSSNTIAASLTGVVGVGGAVSLVTIGSALDTDSQKTINDEESGNSTSAYINKQASQDNVSRELGDSEHVQGIKTDVSTKSGSVEVASDIDATTAADKTQASIGAGSIIDAGRDVNVSAVDKTKIEIVTGGLAVGGVAGVGGAVGIGIKKSTTEAFIGAGTVVDAVGDVAVNADTEDVDAEGSKITAYGAAAGYIGIGAAVAYLDSNNTTKASLEDGVAIDSADHVVVDAREEISLTSNAVGAAGGAGAVGGSLSHAKATGSVSAYTGANVEVGNNGVNAGTLTVEATSEDAVISNSLAGAAGIYSGSGAVATAANDSVVGASTGSNNTVNLDGEMKVNAEATPQAKAVSGAVAISVVGSVGASTAKASVSPPVTASLGSNNTINAGSLNVAASKKLASSVPSADADAVGASGGLLLGVSATSSTAEDESSVTASVNDGSTITTTGATSVVASSDSKQTADATGLNVGFLAIGANVADANSDATTKASLGNNVAVSGTSLTVQATGTDENYADSVAGSGGVISGQAAIAKTNTTSLTSATIGSGTDARGIDVATFNVDADHTSTFDSTVNSINAAIVGASGAFANNVSNSTVQAGTAGTYVKADAIVLSTSNNVLKPTGPSWNVQSGSGGVIDAPAARSETDIINITSVNVGNGTQLLQNVGASPDSFNVKATNDVVAYDKVKLDSGGLISVADAQSHITADQIDASVVVGDGATLMAEENLDIQVYGTGTINTQSSADAYGLAGAPSGKSVSRYNADNSIEVGQLSYLLAMNDVNLEAGSSNNINVKAQTDLWNKTAFPVSTKPKADAIVTGDAIINIHAGADVSAAHDINLFAERGSLNANIAGVGKDIYRETAGAVVSGISNLFGGDDVSFDIPVVGEKTTGGSTTVQVDGTARAGVMNIKSITIDAEGLITANDAASDYLADFGYESGIPVDKFITDRIAWLRSRKAQYDGEPVQVAALDNEIAFLEKKLAEMAIANPDGGAASKAGPSPYSLAEARRDNLDTKITDTTNTKAADPAVQAYDTAVTVKTSAEDSQLGLYDPADYSGVDYYVERQARYDTWQTAVTDGAAAGVIADAETAYNELNDFFGQYDGHTQTIETSDLTISTNQSIVDGYDQDITNFNTQRDDIATAMALNVGEDGYLSRDPAEGITANMHILPNMEAKVGDVNVRADSLVGSGTLKGEGYAKIEITNYSRDYLDIGALNIPADEGGKVTLNGLEVGNNDQINALNKIKGQTDSMQVFTTDNSADPEILITSHYDPLGPKPSLDDTAPDYATKFATYNGPAPDIMLNGDANNLRGLFSIDSEAGGILISGDVNAGTIQIGTKNGDIIQSYVDGFRHVAGEASEIFGDQTKHAGSLTANGSIFMAGRYLNLNGTVQSGYADWSVRIPNTIQVNVGGSFTTDFTQADTDYAAHGGTGLYAVSGTGYTGNPGWQEVADITVTYNALEKRLEVSGVQVLGGYIDIFGQVINTAKAYETSFGSKTVTVEAAGNLRALDGYGRIDIRNETGMDLMINGLDAGRGTEGVISITDVHVTEAANPEMQLYRTVYTYDRANGNIIKETATATKDTDGNFVYNLSPVSDSSLLNTRTTAYNPRTGSRYSWASGVVTGSESTLLYYSQNLIGLIEIASGETPSILLEGPTDLSSSNLDASEYYTTDGAGAYSYTESDPPISLGETDYIVDSWTDCNWWTLCIDSTNYTKVYRYNVDKIIRTHSLKADYDVGIEFIGQSEGSINVWSEGNVMLGNNVTNRSGSVAITSNSGSISQQSDTALITATSAVDLAAATGIGSGSQSIQTNVRPGGVLSAGTTSGDVFVNQLTGDLIVDSVTTSDGYVNLDAYGSLLMNDPATSLVKGNYVNLIARNGSIGVLDVQTPANDLSFNVEVGEPANPNDLNERNGYGLEALSRDSINIVQKGGGDLYLVAVESQQGDVRVDAGAGQIIDNNSAQYADVRTIEELEALWDEMRLQGQKALDKVDDTVIAYENSKTQNYKNYWRMRLNDNGTADTADDSYAPYDPNYSYMLTDVQSSALTEQYEAQALRDETLITQEQRNDFVQDKRDEYVQSKTDEYFFLHGDVGGLNDGIYDALYTYEATTEEHDAFANKVQWSDEQLRLGMTPGMLKEVTDTRIMIEEPNVKGNSVTLISGDNIGSTEAPVFIAVTDDLTADTPEAQEARLALMTAERADIEAVYNANGVDIDGFNITQRDTLDISMDGVNGGFDATAGGYAYIGSEGSVNLVNLDAQGDIRLKVTEGITGVANPTGAHITGENLILEASNGGIGVAGNPLQIDLTSAGVAPTLTMRADGDIFILEAANDINVDSIFSRGTVYLETPGSIFDAIGDYETNIRSASIGLMAGGAIGSFDNYLEIGLNPDGYFSGSAVTGVYVASVDQPMNIGVVDTATGAISLSAASNLGLGSVSTGGGGTVTLVSSGGSIENNLAPGAVNIDAAGSTLVLQAQTGMGSGAPIETRVDTIEVTLGGDGEANIHEADDLNLGTSQALEGSINLVAEGSITSTITGPQVGLIKNLSLEARGGSINVEEAQVSNLMTVKADNIRLGNVINPDGTGPLHFNVSGYPMSDMVRIGTTSQAPIIFDSVSADYFYLNAWVDNLLLNHTLIGSFAEVNNNKYKVIVDNKNKVLHPADVQLYTGSSLFSLEMFADKRIKTDARVVNYDPSFIVNEYSSENSMLRTVGKQLQLSEDAGNFYGYDMLSNLQPSHKVQPGDTFILQGDVLGIGEEEELVDFNDVVIVAE